PIQSPPGRLGLAPMLATASSAPPTKAAAALARRFQGALAARGAVEASRVTEDASLIDAFLDQPRLPVPATRETRSFRDAGVQPSDVERWTRADAPARMEIALARAPHQPRAITPA